MSHFLTLLNVEKPWMVDEKLEPFEECTTNPDYLVFEDRTQECETEYEGNTTAVRLLNGTIVDKYDSRFFGRYKVEKGKVYKRYFGKKRIDKRTKKAKKMQVLENYPFKKIYKNLKEFAENYKCFSYNEKENKFGYYYNPNSYWDWYQIGGRWPLEILVKDNVKDVVLGQRSWATKEEKKDAPVGYKWVCGAKKCDIEWELMKQLELNRKREHYQKLKTIFETGIKPQYSIMQINENEIIGYNGKVIFKKGETESEYLDRIGVANKSRYWIEAYALIKDGEWIGEGEMHWFGISTDEKAPNIWRETVSQYIENIPDNEYIVCVDCHI